MMISTNKTKKGMKSKFLFIAIPIFLTTASLYIFQYEKIKGDSLDKNIYNLVSSSVDSAYVDHNEYAIKLKLDKIMEDDYKLISSDGELHFGEEYKSKSLVNSYFTFAIEDNKEKYYYYISYPYKGFNKTPLVKVVVSDGSGGIEVYKNYDKTLSKSIYYTGWTITDEELKESVIERIQELNDILYKKRSGV